MKLKLVDFKDEIGNAKSFFWKAENEFTWKPGQYLYFTLPSLKYPDARGATRHFTISSSLTEGNTIRLTTRIREESGYKKTLGEMAIGTTVEGEGPSGIFTIDENSKTPYVFIAGGIGITPFRSIIKYAFDKKISVPIYLIYSNSDENFIFGDELKELDNKNDIIHIYFHNSSQDGHLDGDNITKILDNWNLQKGTPNFMVSGPPQMVSAIEEVLTRINVPQDHFVIEKFIGY